jgi:hypothetical protein
VIASARSSTGLHQRSPALPHTRVGAGAATRAISLSVVGFDEEQQ